jgi:hypothetical protein
MNNNLFDKKLNRPMFRVQFKRWIFSNVGDFIEYEMIVQALEGSRNIWALTKRYTDFVKLHEDFGIYFRL